MTELVATQARGIITREEFKEEVEFAADLAAKAVAGSTATAYESAWRQWEDYAVTRGFSALPAQPSVVATFIGALVKAGRSITTVQKSVAAIRRYHEQAGYDSPTTAAVVRNAVAGARRTLPRKPARQARDLTVEEIYLMSEACPNTEVGIRERALLLVGVALGLRSSSLVALDAEDCQPVQGGYDVTLRTSKTDQEGRGVTVALGRAPRALLCPVEALTALLEQQPTGALFRTAGKGSAGVRGDRLTPSAVTRIYRRMAQRAGVSTRNLSSHSARATFITLAFAAGVEMKEISRVSGHKSLENLKTYDRSSRWITPASAMIWGA